MSLASGFALATETIDSSLPTTAPRTIRVLVRDDDAVEGTRPAVVRDDEHAPRRDVLRAEDRRTEVRIDVFSQRIEQLRVARGESPCVEPEFVHAVRRGVDRGGDFRIDEDVAQF